MCTLGTITETWSTPHLSLQFFMQSSYSIYSLLLLSIVRQQPHAGNGLHAHPSQIFLSPSHLPGLSLEEVITRLVNVLGLMVVEPLEVFSVPRSTSL